MLASSSAACSGGVSRRRAPSSSGSISSRASAACLGLERGEQLLAARATEVLEEVGQLAGPQPLQPLVRCSQPHVRHLARKGWMAAQSITRSGVARSRQPPRAEPAQEGLGADVDADQAEAARRCRLAGTTVAGGATGGAATHAR